MRDEHREFDRRAFDDATALSDAYSPRSRRDRQHRGRKSNQRLFHARRLRNTRSPVLRIMIELAIPELVENRRRSIAMLPTGAPALNRDEALELLEQLKAALLELRRLRAP